MFDNDARYASVGIGKILDTGTQNLLWLIIDSMETETKDSLQLFVLSASNGGQQKIVHAQTTPYHREVFAFPCSNPVSEKIYVISDGTTGTMILASEYLREEE